MMDAIDEMARLDAYAVPDALPTVATMFDETRLTMVDLTEGGVLTAEELDNALRFAFFAGFCHGNNNQVCRETVNMAHVVEVQTTLKSLRTYGAYRQTRRAQVEQKLHAP